MTTFVLVPGAMHGKWTWDRVIPLLEAYGHKAVAEDLPGMASREGAPPAADVTLALWADFVADLARAAEGRVILAGHSRGGLVIGEAAERLVDTLGERLAGLIYVAGLIAPPGQTGRAASGTAGAPGGDGVARIDPALATDMFYHRCAPADAEWATARLCAEPLKPLATPVSATWERWGRVPRAYIACSDDRVLTPGGQQKLLAAAPCDPVITLDSDHSPFLSTPAALAAAMNAIAARFSSA